MQISKFKHLTGTNPKQNFKTVTPTSKCPFFSSRKPKISLCLNIHHNMTKYAAMNLSYVRVWRNEFELCPRMEQ